MPETSPRTVLLVRAGPHVCGLPLASVAETMRPLAVAPLSGVPAYVLGAAVVRGKAAPVVHLAALLGAPGATPPTRFVRIRATSGDALLAVDAVTGVVDVSHAEAVPLLARAAAGVVDTLGALDGELLSVLDAAHVVPPEAWAALAAGSPAGPDEAPGQAHRPGTRAPDARAVDPAPAHAAADGSPTEGEP